MWWGRGGVSSGSPAAAAAYRHPRSSRASAIQNMGYQRLQSIAMPTASRPASALRQRTRPPRGLQRKASDSPTANGTISGVGGVSIDNMGLLAPTWVDPIPSLIGKKTALVSCEWYNQKDATTTKGAAFLSARKAIANQQTVWGTSSSAIDPSADRASYDSASDAMWAGSKTNIDSYVSIHTDAHIGVDGSYATYSTGGDSVHLTYATSYRQSAFDIVGGRRLNA